MTTTEALRAILAGNILALLSGAIVHLFTNDLGLYAASILGYICKLFRHHFLTDCAAPI